MCQSEITIPEIRMSAESSHEPIKFESDDSTTLWVNEVVTRWYTAIRSFFKGQLPMSADDQTQEVFLRFTQAAQAGRTLPWKTLADPTDDELMWTRMFLFRTARIVLFEAFRRTSTARRHMSRCCRTLAVSETAEIDRADLKDALCQLTKADESLIRAIMEGHTQAEIAAGMGVSEGLISRRKTRAYAALRKLLPVPELI